MVIVVTGVSGAGKTTVGQRLARRLGYAFEEGDDFHPPANVAKMRSGEPLDDADREPWLRALAAAIDAWLAAGRNVVLTCSALKRAYREVLVDGREGVRLVYLHGERELLHERLAARRGHFMPPGLLDSQFAALEPPAPDEEAVAVDVSGGVDGIVEKIVGALGL